jgi:hypothetical protein
MSSWDKKRYAEDADYRARELERRRAYVRAHKAQVDVNRRRGYLQRRYGLSRADYDALLKRQGGVCAICGKPSEKTLCVDHCHATGTIRGLLCRKCNLGLRLPDRRSDSADRGIGLSGLERSQRFRVCSTARAVDARCAACWTERKSGPDPNTPALSFRTAARTPMGRRPKDVKLTPQAAVSRMRCSAQQRR